MNLERRQIALSRAQRILKYFRCDNCTFSRNYYLLYIIWVFLSRKMLNVC